MTKLFGLIPRSTMLDKTRSRATPPKMLTLEHVVATIGVAVAVASGAFAVTKLSEDPRQNELAVAASSPWRMVGGVGSNDNAGVDRTITGTIPTDPAPSALGAARGTVVGETAMRPLPGFALHDVFRGVALVAGPAGLSEVKPGSYLEGAGTVMSIERRADRWVVVTSQGLIEDSASPTTN